jgi:hypothetical protein
MPQSYDFKDGKMWPNDRPGLGVTLDTSKLHLAADYTEHYASDPAEPPPGRQLYELVTNILNHEEHQEHQ